MSMFFFIKSINSKEIILRKYSLKVSIFKEKHNFVGKNCQFKTSARSVEILLKKIDSIELITA